MTRKLLGGISVAAMLAGLQPAFSADMPVKAVAAPAPVALHWYATVFGGVSRADDYKFNFANDATGARFGYTVSLDYGYVFGGAFGREIHPNIRIEVEVAHSRYKFSDDYRSGTFAGQGESGSMRVTTVTGNAWFGVPTGVWGAWAYAGAGVGVGFVDGSLTVTNGAGRQFDGDDKGLAVMLGNGVRIPVARNFELDLGYRFRLVSNINFPSAIAGFSVKEGSNITTHSFQGALTLKF